MTHPFLRKDLQALSPYSSARSLYESSNNLCYLDANEYKLNIYSSYPEPQPPELKKALCQLYGVNEQNLLITRGIDEGIDCFLRTFGEPKKDAIVVFEPTYDLYRLSAQIQQLEVINIPLENNFQIDMDIFESSFRDHVKCVFVCSPNNPTGNSIKQETIHSLLNFCKDKCLVVVDEAYIEFSEYPSFTDFLEKYPHLVVMRTLSKAHGLAGARCGSVIAEESILNSLKITLAPYPIATPATKAIIEHLNHFNKSHFLSQKLKVHRALKNCPLVSRVYESDANFYLFESTQPDFLFNTLLENGVLIRDRQKKKMNCLRVSIGNEAQNNIFIKTLRSIT